MNCCIDCFCDSHIRSIIAKQGVTGNCDFCSSKNISVYDVTVIPNPLADLIVDLIQIYSVSDSTDAKPLKVALRDDWNIFNGGSELIQTLVKKLCESTFSENDDIFSRNVIISQLMDSDFLREFGVVRGHSWDEFSNSIKYINRFHSGMFNADAFASFLSIIAKIYPIGSTFYRARISAKKEGLEADKMGAAPKEKRSAGRINPEGIGILYLSSDSKTVVNEVRANAFDYVTIGKFQSLRNIKLVNLSGIARTSPFLYGNGLEQFAANRKVIQEIAFEVAKPLRRSDSPLEYLPTQYITEFIKSQNYDGVEYASTLREGGFNIAVFDEKLFDCVEVQTVEVSEILYKTNNIEA